MTKLMKADIDALVEAMPRVHDRTEPNWIKIADAVLWDSEVRRVLFLAAGLQADGSAKPERVPAWLYMSRVPNGVPVFGNPTFGTWDGTTFIPDGAE